MQQFFKRAFNIRADEFTLVQSFFLYYVSISMFITIGFSIGDSLFLTYIEQEKVQVLYAWGYVGIAAVTICVTWLYAKIMEFVSRICLILGMQLLFLLSVFAVRQFISLKGPSSNEWVYLGLVLLLKVSGQLLIVQFFSFAGDYFTIRHARRVYGYIAGGLATGSILGGMMVGPGVSLIGPMNMLYVCMGLLTIGIGLSLFIYMSATPVAFSDKKRQAEPSQKTPLRTTMARPYLRSIVLITLIGAICFVLVDFQMKVSAKHVYVNSADLATFLGNFYMYAGIMTALVQFSLVGFFLRQFGIISCLMILPWLQAVMSLLFYVTGYGFFAGSSLFIISSANFFRITLTESLDLPSRELLFLPLSSRLRIRAQAIMGGIIEPLGQGIGGMLIIGFSYLITPLFQYSLLVFSFACVWLLLLLCLQPRYRNMLSSSLKGHTLNAETLQDVVQSPIHDSLLEELLQSHEKRIVSLTLDIMHTYPLAGFTSQLITLVSHSQSDIAAKAIDLLGADGNIAHLDILDRALTSSSSAVRKAAVLAVCRIQREAALDRVSQWIENPDLVLKYAAFVACGRYCGPAGKELIQPILKQMAYSPVPGERRIAADLIRDIHDPGHAFLLERLLDDSDLTVRMTAVKACRAVPSPVLMSHLLRLFRFPELYAFVLDVLEQMPEEYVSIVSNDAQDLNLDETARSLLFRVLGSIGGMTAQEHLWDVFSDNGPVTVRVAAGNALWRIALRNPLLEISEQDFERALEVLCKNIKQLNQGCAEAADSDTVIWQFLRDQARLEIECLFQLLSFKYDIHQLEKVQYNFFSSGPMQQANALELLDDILPRRLAPRIGELLDAFLQKRTLHGPGLSAETIQHIIRMESWLKAIVIYYRRENNSIKLSKSDGELSTHIKKVAFLKHVSLFQDVPANYLLPLAEISGTIRLDSGETLFSQGDLGDAMYLIRSGAIDIVVNGIVVNHMGLGECIGEMAILGDTRRTASCIAREETELLEISAQHFQTIVKSQTSVALAVLRTLSRRLRRQTNGMVAQNSAQSRDRRLKPSRGLATSSLFFQERPPEQLDETQELHHLLKQIALLKDLALFKHVPENKLVPLARMSRDIMLEKGETLFHQGEQGHAIYFICHGSFSVQVNDIEVSCLQAGNCLGEMAILDGEPRSASCVALEKSELLSLSETDFEIIVKNHTSVALALLKTLARKLRRQTRNTIRRQMHDRGFTTRFSE